MSTGKVKLKVKQESDIVDPVIKRAINKANEPKMVGSPPKKREIQFTGNEIFQNVTFPRAYWGHE